MPKMFYILKFIIWSSYLLHSNYAARHPVSPCPNVFSFEGEQENDRWSGVINFSSNIELAGLTYKIQLDRPSQLLVSWDGEVRTDDNTLYHVNNQYRVQKPGEMGRAQIMVKFDPVLGPPGIVKIVINGNTVCPPNAGTSSGSGGRVPSVGLSIDSTTERFDPSFNENEDTRPDFPAHGGTQNSNTNYGSNQVYPNRIPTSGSNYGNTNQQPNYGSSNQQPNYGNPNLPNYGNSNSQNYGNSNPSNAGAPNNPIYTNSNQQPNYGSSNVHYSNNPPVQSGVNYGGSNRPSYSENTNYNNANQPNNWPNNAGSGNNAGFPSNPVNGYNNPQSNTPYSNGTSIISANNPEQIIQLFNNLLSQRNPNASSPTLVVAILPVSSSPEPTVLPPEIPTTIEPTQKFRTSTFSTTTASTTPPTSTTSSIVNRSRNNTTTSNKLNSNLNSSNISNRN